MVEPEEIATNVTIPACMPRMRVMAKFDLLGVQGQLLQRPQLCSPRNTSSCWQLALFLLLRILLP